MSGVILALDVLRKKVTAVEGGDEVLCRTSWQKGHELPSSTGDPGAALLVIFADERRLSETSG